MFRALVPFTLALLLLMPPALAAGVHVEGVVAEYFGLGHGWHDGPHMREFEGPLLAQVEYDAVSHRWELHVRAPVVHGVNSASWTGGYSNLILNLEGAPQTGFTGERDNGNGVFHLVTDPLGPQTRIAIVFEGYGPHEGHVETFGAVVDF